MQFSTPSKNSHKRDLKQTSISLLVSLFLILLTIFVILSSGSSYDKNKQESVKQSVEDTFGKKKETIIFGRLAYLKLDDHAIELEKIVKKYGTVTTNIDEDKLRITIPLANIYYSDEPSFLSDAVPDMMKLMRALKNWSDNETIRITVNLAQTNFQQDYQRLEFFHKYIEGKRPLIGVEISNNKDLNILVERDS